MNSGAREAEKPAGEIIAVRGNTVEVCVSLLLSPAQIQTVIFEVSHFVGHCII